MEPRAPALADHPVNVLVILVIALVLIPVAATMVTGLLGLENGLGLAGEAGRALGTLVSLLLSNGVLLSLTLFHVLGPQGLGRSPAALGLVVQGWRQEVRAGLAWGGALLAVNAAGYWAGQGLFRRLLPEDLYQALLQREEAVLVDLFRADLPGWLLAALVVSAVIIAPVVEELFFRGYAHAVLRHRLGTRALWASAGLFAGVHLYLVHFLPIFLIGLLLARLYELRGKLIAPVVAHAAANGVVALYLITQG